MPKYKYTAKQGPTKIVEDIIDADNVDIAIKHITSLGLMPIDVSEFSAVIKETQHKSWGASFFVGNKIRSADIVNITMQLSDLVDASVPMLRALHIILNQTSNSAMRHVIGDIYVFVQDGGSFSNALAQHPEVFTNLYINMVKTGESSGTLDKVLSRLAGHLEKEQDTIRKIRASLAYPMLILGVGILTVFVLLTFVIPNLTVMFDDLDQALPWPTVLLTNISFIFARFWWIMLGVVGVGIVCFMKWSSSPLGKKTLDEYKLRIPFLGTFIKVSEISRFSRTLGTLLENGVHITTAINSVALTIDNFILRQEIEKVADEVTNGSSFAHALNHCSLFPDMAINIISVGEETGRLDKGLFKIADTFERQSDSTVKMIVSLLGPIVLIFIVMLVGFVVIAMLLPIFQMNLLIQ